VFDGGVNYIAFPHLFCSVIIMFVALSKTDAGLNIRYRHGSRFFDLRLLNLGGQNQSL